MRRYILFDDMTKLSACLDGFGKEEYDVVGCVSLSLVRSLVNCQYTRKQNIIKRGVNVVEVNKRKDEIQKWTGKRTRQSLSDVLRRMQG